VSKQPGWLHPEDEFYEAYVLTILGSTDTSKLAPLRGSIVSPTDGVFCDPLVVLSSSFPTLVRAVGGNGPFLTLDETRRPKAEPDRKQNILLPQLEMTRSNSNV